MTKSRAPCEFLARSLLLLCAVTLASCSMMPGTGGDRNRVALSGSQEVPPVPTSASGAGTITVKPDGTVSGSVTTTGITSTVAHIHTGAPGTNGPVIIPLAKAGETYTVPPGAKLTDAQMSSYRQGNLYVNVHSAKYPGGEIRAQMTP
jgi:predicted small secreted protein